MSEADLHSGDSLAESIAADLKQRIVTGQLAAGERIVQNAVAEQYGVSRLPVREALRALSNSGLVDLEPSRGARVRPFDRAEMREVCLMREQLEPMAIAEAVSRITPADLEEAAEILARMELSSPEDGNWLALDRQFHTLWYDRLGMPLLHRTIDQLWDLAHRYRAAFSMTSGAREISDLEHHLMLHAIRRGAAEDVAAILGVHLRHVRNSLETGQ